MPPCCGAIGGNGIRGVRTATITGRDAILEQMIEIFRFSRKIQGGLDSG